jgi:Cu+-exporting ATPase
MAVPRLTESDVLRLAASLELASEHPLAAAVIEAAASQKLELDEVRGFRTIPGKGLVGAIDGRAVAFGNLKLLEGLAVDPGDLRKHAEILRRNGRTIMFLAIDGKAAGLISVADPIKAQRETLHGAKKHSHCDADRRQQDYRGCRRIKTRDKRCVRSMPQDKGEIVKEFQRQGRIVAMAGDGINDGGLSSECRHRDGGELMSPCRAPASQSDHRAASFGARTQPTMKNILKPVPGFHL